MLDDPTIGVRCDELLLVFLIYGVSKRMLWGERKKNEIKNLENFSNYNQKKFRQPCSPFLPCCGLMAKTVLGR